MQRGNWSSFLELSLLKQPLRVRFFCAIMMPLQENAFEGIGLVVKDRFRYEHMWALGDYCLAS